MISTEKRSPTTFQYSCAATEKCIIILYTFCVYIFYPDNFGSHVPSCFSYHVFSHVLLFNCCYEVSLVVPLPPLGLIYILQTRPLFKFAFIFNTFSHFFQFSRYFLSLIFQRILSYSPEVLVAFPNTGLVWQYWQFTSSLLDTGWYITSPH